jgi:hypothetical protein
VLHIRDDRLATISCFLDTHLAQVFGHAPTID